MGGLSTLAIKKTAFSEVKLAFKHRKCQWAQGGARGTVNQEQNDPDHLPGVAFPVFSSLTPLCGWRGAGLLSVCLSADSAPLSLSLDGSAEAPGVGVAEVLES